ncbi:MAG: hypothetical protein M3Z50_10680 [Actinomycetota bacterium]|nr:hypothetical protein [Actinomycetota bacterium]
MTRRLSLGAVVIVAAAMVTGCGASSSHPLTAKEKKAAHSIATSFQLGGMTAKEATCVADKWVGAVGTPKLVSAGVLTASLQMDPKNQKLPKSALVKPYADAYFGCVDYGRLEAVKFDQVRPHTINDKDFAACANKINQADAKQALVDDLLQRSTKVAADVQHQLLVCAGELGG